ncbi:MAG: DUF1722 domain-containing protein, partial [Pseudomonadales bacterium]
MSEIPDRPDPPLTLGISDCLLGREVRYDGSGAKSSFPHAVLTGLYEFRGICPEVGIGMGVPRPPIRLVARDGIRAVGVNQGELDYTDALAAYAGTQAAGLTDVAGYVLMKNSPSCGLYRVKVYPENKGAVSGAPARTGRGIYAAALAEMLPNLPMEETGRLNDVVLRENFVMRTFAYAHWLSLLRAGLTRGRLVAFHSRYKYLLMAHSVPHYQSTGRVLSNLKTDFEAKAQEYVGLLMAGLAVPASRGGHANVLAH